MRAIVALFSLCLAVSAQEDNSALMLRDQAFLEVLSARDTYYVQERVTLRLRIGFDRKFFGSNALQLFRRELDLPVRVEAPWRKSLEGTLPCEPAPTTAAGEGKKWSLVLNDRISRLAQVADQVIGNRRFTVLEITKSFLPTRVGPLAVPPASMRFSYTEGFTTDALQGRMAANRRDALIDTQILTLRIDPLPPKNRPADFSGAVGRYTIRASARPTRLRAGANLRLSLHIEGQGNLAHFTPPKLARLPGFHAFGRIEERHGKTRTITYDLVPLHQTVRAVPPIPFNFFDPTRGYQTIHTKPLPLTVQPLPAGMSLPPLPGRGPAIAGQNDIHGLKPITPDGNRREGLSLCLVLTVFLSPWFLALGLLVWLRARARALSDPAGIRARNAAANFTALMASGKTDPARALAEYLAARLRCSEANLIGPELTDLLTTAGIPPTLAQRTTESLHQLSAARYGGDQTTNGQASVQALVEELEGIFHGREERQ